MAPESNGDDASAHGTDRTMRGSIAIIVAFAGAAACASKKKDDAPAPVSADATVAKGPAIDATATVSGQSVDAAAAAAPIDAAAAPAVPATPAAAGTFLLYSETIPLDAALVLGPLDGEPALAPNGAGASRFDEGDDRVVTARALASMPAAYAGLANARLDIHDEDEVVCTVTVGDPVAVRSVSTSGDVGVATRTAARNARPLDPTTLWTAGDGVTVWTTYAAATVRDVSGDCTGGLFAVPAGQKVTRTKLAAAKEWDGSIEAFDKADFVRMSNEKHDLEGWGAASSFTSARRLGPAEGPSLALLYGKSGESERTIVVLRVPGVDVDDGHVVGALFAPAPSVVAGVDANGDGVLDVVIGHADGVALVDGNGQDGLAVTDGSIGPVSD
jgi:hypothetical protein